MWNKVKCFFRGHHWAAFYSTGWVCLCCHQTIVDNYEMKPRDRIIRD